MKPTFVMIERSGVVAPPVAGQIGDKNPEAILIHLPDVLAAAETVDSLDLVVDYLAWARALFVNLGLPATKFSTALAEKANTIERNGDLYQLPLANLLRRGLEQLARLAPGFGGLSSLAAPLGDLADRYLAALLAEQDMLAEQMVIDAVDRGLTIVSLYRDVFAPVLQEVGRLWHANQITVAQEHFISSATQMVMARFYLRLFSGAGSGPVMVMCCVEGELHEIAARMVTDLFQLQGWDSHFIGADASAQMVASFVDHVDADLVAISAMMTANIPALSAQIALLRARDRDGKRKILVGGYPFSVDGNLWRRVGADGSAGSAESAVARARSWLQPWIRP